MIAATRTPNTPARFLAIALLALTAIAHPARADDDRPRRSVTVTGQGEVNARPDMATVSTGVVTEDQTARAALDANTAAMTKLIASLKAGGVAAKDIRTSNFNVSPVYTQPKERNERPRIDGYRVSNAVTVAVRDLEKLGPILDSVVGDGANQAGGIQFGFADPDALEQQARKAAIADAKARAELYAAAAGAKLGKVMTIAETGYAPPRPYATRALAKEAAAPVPVEAGEQAVTASVSVTWELE
ncbi:MAG: SIMPL domain-containing protein [Hyphomicrobiales bacterium]